MLNTAEFRQTVLQLARTSLAQIPPEFIKAHQQTEITIVILSYGRIEMTLGNIEALLSNVTIPFKLLLIDTAASPSEIEALATFCSKYQNIELVLLKQNLGIAGTRQFSLDLVATEYVLFVDNDMEVLPGAVEQLLYTLEQQPAAVAVAGKIIFPDGIVQMCGANYYIHNGVFYFGFKEEGKHFTDTSPVTYETCNWVNGGFTLLRKRYLAEHPYDSHLGYFEDLEWSYRLNQLGRGLFFNNSQAIGIHHHLSKLPAATFTDAQKHQAVVKNLEMLAYLYKKYKIIVQNVFDYIPELRPLDEPYTPKVAALALELINLLGKEWFLSKWDQGELAPLLLAPNWKAQAAENEATLHIKIGEYQRALEHLESSFQEKILHVSLLQNEVAHFREQRDKLLKILQRTNPE